MADGANRHLAQKHRVTRLRVDLLTRYNGVTNGNTLWADDVSLLTVFILQKRDEGSAVRVVFDPLDSRRNIPLTTLEVDEAVLLLVTTADATRSDMAFVVPATGLTLAFRERLDRLAFVQAGLVDKDEAGGVRGSSDYSS